MKVARNLKYFMQIQLIVDRHQFTIRQKKLYKDVK